MATDERWIFGHALDVEFPQVGTFARSTAYSKLTLVSGSPVQHNWLLAAVPAPNVSEGWRISAIMLRFATIGTAGFLDKVGVRDGEQPVHGFENLNVGPQSNWTTLQWSLPTAKPFKFGLGVGIHVSAFPTALGPIEFRFVGVGLTFVR